jgi:hypothetical protein
MKKRALIVGISIPKSNFGVQLVSEKKYSYFYNNGKKDGKFFNYLK